MSRVFSLHAVIAVALSAASLMAQGAPLPKDLAENPFPKRERPNVEELYDFDAGFLGVHHRTHSFLFWDSGKGSEVMNVARGSPAHRAGIVPGDIITHLQGHRVSKSEELDRYCRETPAGTLVVIDLIRGAKRYQTVCQLAYPPELDSLYTRTSVSIPAPVPFILDYEEYKAFDYVRVNFVWPVIQFERTGRKRTVTLVTWPLRIQYEKDR